ncbi:hypothetical protein [Lewinella sp. 4G2]|uniref:hypothetical protein n=1 Tax=Lewinella sp. 4G2 TaxID=1803372 RepID=UPI0012F9CA46|nr:hypothetical protein [Lewinella sp. 4G2]
MKYSINHVYTDTAIKSIEVVTNIGTDACGYFDEIGGESIITAMLQGDRYYTAREDCARNISRRANPTIFKYWLTLLNTLTMGKDGDYHFRQNKSTHDEIRKDLKPNLPGILFSIKNGKLNGGFQVYSLKGDLLVKGRYRNGEKHGRWSYFEAGLTWDLSYWYSTLTKIKYKGGQLMKSTTDMEYTPFQM